MSWPSFIGGYVILAVFVAMLLAVGSTVKRYRERNIRSGTESTSSLSAV